VATAGAYVLANGRFAFMVGPTPQGDSLAVLLLRRPDLVSAKAPHGHADPYRA
jgi:hypothetical protein